MQYKDGNIALLGDSVRIDTIFRGVVVGVVENSQYADGLLPEQWNYLKKGILVDTDFGGIVHYPDTANEDISLAARKT